LSYRRSGAYQDPPQLAPDTDGLRWVFRFRAPIPAGMGMGAETLLVIRVASNTDEQNTWAKYSRQYFYGVRNNFSCGVRQ